MELMASKQLISQELESRFNAIFETCVDGIITIDIKGTIETANTAAAKMFGYQVNELIGQKIEKLMPEPHCHEHQNYIDRYLQSGKAKIIGIGRELIGLKKDGSTFPFRMAVSEVRLAENLIFTGIIHDISEIKEAEQKLKGINAELEQRVNERTAKLTEAVNKMLSTNKELEREISERTKVERKLEKSRAELENSLGKEKELSELKSKFVTVASHEFRTPLSTILSSISLVERYQTTETQDKRARHIHRIKTSVRNMNSILNDFLSLEKIERGVTRNNPALFDIEELGNEVIEEFDTILKEDDKIDFEFNGLKFIFLDDSLIRNIMMNLLSNAIKYSKEPKKIFVKIESQSGKIKILVKDEGIGIPMKEQKHLFERFFRANNATNIQQLAGCRL